MLDSVRLGVVCCMCDAINEACGGAPFPAHIILTDNDLWLSYYVFVVFIPDSFRRDRDIYSGLTSFM